MPSVLEKVTYVFTSKGDPTAWWRVVRMHSREALSEVYSAVLDLANEDLGADPDKMLGRDAEPLIQRDALVRRVVGVVHRVEHRGTTAGHLLCRVHVVPALYALALRTDSRIFQDQSVMDTVKSVLGESLAPFQRVLRDETRRAFPVREYCTQYRETDLDFVARLMAEEGITYSFDFSGDEEVMVLADANEPYQPVATVDGSPSIPIMGAEAGTATVEAIGHFDLIHQLRTTSLVVRDFDWTQPTLDLTRESRATDVNGHDREAYEYPGAMTIGDYSRPRYTEEDGAAQARIRRERHKAGERRFEGDGYVTGFAPGVTFTLEEHGAPAFNQDYLVTRVEHRGVAPEELTNDVGAAAAAGERYHNRFECIPTAAVYRPARSVGRPRVSGVQTATVVGPAGEEIYTDEHGRIKVQFHWDRDGQRNESSSAWIRSMQPWAGPGWGFVFLPRIGMEVVVEFLEGNPDRPLIMGCVYNGTNTPPYPLPDEKTKSTIKTSSSPGGNGSNELRFEDAAGSEEIYIHAQKDFNEVVEHDHTTRVKNNHANTVDVNDSESVGGDQSLSVSGNRTKTIKKDEKTTVHQNRIEVVDIDETITVHGKRTETVDGNETIAVHGNRTETVDGNETVTIAGNQQMTLGGNRADTIGGNDSFTLGGNQESTLGGNRTTTVGGGETATVGGAQTESVGGARSVSVGGDDTLAVNANLIVDAATNMTLVAGSTGTLQGATINVNASGEIVLAGGGSSIKISAAGVEINGASVKIAGGSVDITGGLVKIN
ncbi:MAG: type VI secretion system tip protein VgrG [Deltaproteobacteria bacterium]|nr:type VI secretion system tip protein VgrG [Deltaproteobacteria bacterium]